MKTIILIIALGIAAEGIPAIKTQLKLKHAQSLQEIQIEQIFLDDRPADASTETNGD